MVNIIAYYVTGHTAKGYVNFIASNIEDVAEVLTLQHPSNEVKTALLKNMLECYKDAKEVEVILHPMRKDFIAGVICREREIAILSDELKVEQGRKIDLTSNLPIDKQAMKRLEAQKNKILTQFYATFQEGLNIHDDLEAIYLEEMDFHKADRVAYDLINSLFKAVDKQNKPSKILERLFGTNTPEGVTKHLASLSERMSNRIFIKGRAGTGKSYLMNKVLTTCQSYGLDVELYHCSFDPDSIDMLIIPDLDLAIFDSTAPHALTPRKEKDEVIDMYEKTVLAGTDEKHAGEIHRVTKAYKRKVNQGLKDLAALQEITKEMEEIASPSSLPELEKYVKQVIAKSDII